MVKESFVKLLSLVTILILASFLMLWRLGEAHLTNWDEAWYGDVARTMAERGNLLTPTWNGQPFLEKPPLFYWLTAISFRLFGDTEFSARFISSLSGIGTLGLLYWFCRKHWGERAAILSSLVLLSTPAFLWRARTGNLDSLLTFLVFLSAVALVEMGKKDRWVYVAGISIGLGFLTKGAIGFLFPIIAAGFFLWKKEGKSLKQTAKALGLATMIAITWFGISYHVNGQLFIQQFFAQQGEKIGSLKTLFGQLSFDYLIHLKTGLKLWFVIFIPSIFYVFAKWREKSALLSAVFVIVFVILLSFLQEKSTWFLHPVYPFVGILCGLSLVQWGRRFRLRSPIVLMGVVLVALFQLVQFRNEYIVPDVAADEARIALAAREFTEEGDTVYLTHYYFPTAVYYSRRRTYAVYSERPSVSWWILPKSAWNQILSGEHIFINTSTEDLKELQRQFPHIRLLVLFQSGDKLLVKKE